MRLLPRCCRKIQAGHGIVGFGLWGFLYNRRNWLFGKFQLAIFMRAGINPAPTRLEVFVGMGFIPIRKRAITGVFRITILIFILCCSNRKRTYANLSFSDAYDSTVCQGFFLLNNNTLQIAIDVFIPQPVPVGIRTPPLTMPHIAMPVGYPPPPDRGKHQ